MNPTTTFEESCKYLSNAFQKEYRKDTNPTTQRYANFECTSQSNKFRGSYIMLNEPTFTELLLYVIILFVLWNECIHV